MQKRQPQACGLRESWAQGTTEGQLGVQGAPPVPSPRPTEPHAPAFLCPMSPLHFSRRLLCLLPSRSPPDLGPRGAIRGADRCVLTGWAPRRFLSMLVTREPVLSTPPRPALTALPVAASQQDSPSLVLTFALRCQGGQAGRKPGALCLPCPPFTHSC